MNIVDKHTERERLSRAGEINDVFKHPSPSPQRGTRICSPFCEEKRGERKKAFECLQSEQTWLN